MGRLCLIRAARCQRSGFETAEVGLSLDPAGLVVRVDPVAFYSSQFDQRTVADGADLEPASDNRTRDGGVAAVVAEESSGSRAACSE
jgi:hypothetical protein